MRVAALCLLAGLLVAAEGVATDSISALKCAEYAGSEKLCSGVTNMGPLVGTKSSEFPHMAHIGYEGLDGDEQDQLLCGGVLVSPNYVLTSAICATDRGPPKFVLLGADEPSPQKIPVAQRVPHPEFKPPARYNDVALLRLEKAATISDAVRPACLHRGPAPDAGDLLVFTSWASGSYGELNETQSLMKVALPVVAHAECNRTLFVPPARLPQGVQDERQICVDGSKSDIDTCQGDSGGPLQLLVRSPHCMCHIVGVGSFAKHCAGSSAPEVYARVAPFVPWIESVVWP